VTLGGAEQTVVADFDEAWREDVLEEAADELLCLEGAVLELVRGRLFVRESELIIFQFAQGGCCSWQRERRRGRDTGKLSGLDF